MCGIVGLFLKDKSLEPQLGALLANMLEVMSDRGPDSAGFAIYGAGDAGHLKLTIRGNDLSTVADALGNGVTGLVRDSHLVLTLAGADDDQVGPLKRQPGASIWQACRERTGSVTRAWQPKVP